MDLAGNKQTAKAFLEDSFAGRIEPAMARLSDDLLWWVIGDPAQLRVSGERNRAQVEKLLRGTARAVPGGLRVAFHGFTAEDDRVAVEAESWGQLHDGREFHNRYHFLIRLRDGLIFEVREYMDSLHAYQAVER